MFANNFGPGSVLLKISRVVNQGLISHQTHHQQQHHSHSTTTVNTGCHNGNIHSSNGCTCLMPDTGDS